MPRVSDFPNLRENEIKCVHVHREKATNANATTATQPLQSEGMSINISVIDKNARIKLINVVWKITKRGRRFLFEDAPSIMDVTCTNETAHSKPQTGPRCGAGGRHDNKIEGAEYEPERGQILKMRPLSTRIQLQFPSRIVHCN